MINTTYTFAINLDFMEKHADILNSVSVAVANLKNSKEFRKQARDKQVHLEKLRTEWVLEFGDPDVQVKGEYSSYYPHNPNHLETQFIAIDTD